MNAPLFIFSKIDIDRSGYWSKQVDASMTAFSKVSQIFDMYVVPEVIWGPDAESGIHFSKIDIDRSI